MHVSVRTLESQAVLTVSVDPLETIGAFKKRAAATLPYNGVCKFMLRGRYLSKHTSFESLELLPHDFLVAFPLAGKQITQPAAAPVSSGARNATICTRGLTGSSISQPASQQIDIHQPSTAAVTLPPAPYTLLPGYVSRPQAMHPLPSELIRADVDPTQSALWADLAAELRSAPISAPLDHHAEAVDQLKSAAASDLPASASGSHQAANWDQSAKRGIRAGQAAAAAAGRVKAVSRDDAPAAKPKPPRQTRCSLISDNAASEATDSANDSNLAAAKEEENSEAQQSPVPSCEWDVWVSASPAHTAHLEGDQICSSKCAWGEEVQVEDVQTMADLCPDVVILRDPQQIQSPNKSIRQWRMSIQTEPAVPSLVNPIDAEDAMLVRQTSGEYTLPVSQAHPMEITTDGSGTVFGGQARRDRLIVEIMDPGRKTIGSTSLAEMGVDEDAAIQEVGMDARSLAARLPSRGPVGSGGRKGQTDKGAKNAQQRRLRAFRQALVRAVEPSHQAFLRELQHQQCLQQQPQQQSEQSLQQQQQQPQRQQQQHQRPDGVSISPQPAAGASVAAAPMASAAEQHPSVSEWNVMERKAWHPLFNLEDLSLETIKRNLDAARAAEAAKELNETGIAADEARGEKPPPRPPQVARKHEPCLDTTHMCTNQFLKHIQQLGWYADQIVHMEDIPARQPQYALPSTPLSEPVQAAIKARNITQMFTHQAQAIDTVLAGRNVVVSTSTASGKSLCYNIPILEALVQDRRACALYMFPTKALAQDQLRALRQMCSAAFGNDAPHVEVYDGDTSHADRGETRDRAQLLITNPDMLHRSILPVHSQFSRILAHLKYVVVDEGHAYKGVFGCHTAFVLRRLRRLCERCYNSHPSFVVTSATVANPREHVQELLGVEQVEVISEDGSPHGPKCFVLWNPPLTVSQQALNKGSKMKMSRTEGRARLTKGGISKRAKQEYVREEMRDANQARGRGSQMGGPEGGLASVNDTEWLSEVRAGRKKAAVLRDAEVLFKEVEGGKSVPLHPARSPPPTAAGSQAAMAAIAATARLPTQAASLAPSNIKYLHSEQPQNRPVIRRQLPSLTAIPENIFRPGTTAGSNPHLSGLAQGAFGGSKRRQREAVAAVDEAEGSFQLPLSSDGLQLIRVSGANAPETAENGDSQGTEKEVREQIQARLPGTDWKAIIGAAGTPMEQQRVSPIVELSMLLAECIQHGLRTLAFCKTRKLCELVTAYTRETLKNTAPHLAKSISVYRAGYSPQERREIEAALHDGDLWAVAATNALELGVDVGSLDVTLHLGFPGSVASLWQQAGRAGRREQPSTSIYIAFDGPLDQYFMKQPDKLFGRAIERAQVDAHNAQLLEQHVCCACSELPVTWEEDQEYFGPGLLAAMDSLVAQNLVSRHPHTTNTRALFYTGLLEVPAAAVSLRAIDPERYAIVNEEDGDVIEEIEESKAFYEVYDGAVYMFQGRTYLCKKLDLGSKVAMVRAADLKYYTKTRDFTDVHVVGGHTAYPVRIGNEQYPSTTACCDAAIVTVRWLGFHRIWQGSGEVFDSIDLFLPDVQFGTQAAYIRVPRAARQRVKDAGLPFRDGLHAASHALLNVVPLYMMCNSTDMAAECDNPYDTRFRPERLLLYDKHPGGIGIAAQATPLFSVLLEKALQLIQSCSCKPASGCPGCVQHTDCGEYNAVLNKFSAIIVLQCTIEAEAEHRERLRLQQQFHP
ncbi:hypothetical protein WJX79_008750 [Trebouxia sp. C0005]